MRLSVLFFLFLSLLAAYALPWVMNPGASLSFSGYDLAEWSSVHPISGGENPPLLTALLLRLPLLCATLTFAFFVLPTWNNRFLGGIVVLLMGVALLPPFEIFDDPGNWNYRQQLALAIIAVLGGLFGLTGWLEKIRPIIGTVAALVGAVAGLVGLSRAYSLIQGFNLPAYIGAGGGVTAILFLGLILVKWKIGRRVMLRRPTLAAQQP